MEIVISIAAQIAGYTVAPVGRWLCYSFNYKSNIQHLKNEEEKLQLAKTRVERSVYDALRSNRGGHVTEDDVEAWLREVNEITILATRILDADAEAETRSSHATCLNLKQRHQLSREANKIAENIVKHRQKSEFPRFTYKKQDHKETTKNKNFVPLESRTLVLKEIMELLLGDSNINKIGVWGLPGVGKSTLMNEIERRAKEEKLFLVVVRIDVNKSPELNEIKGQIEFHKECSRIERLNLQQESSTNKSKMLVILDDIWKELDLEDIGIPSEGCKVVLTSRHRDVLGDAMGIKTILKLKSLPEKEAWNLFEKMMREEDGNCVTDIPGVREVAIEVAKQCAGLPVALITVAKALKGKASLYDWKDAELRLKRPRPEYVPNNLIGDVYHCIKISYDHLAEEEHKSLFLLCALLGRNIYYRDLLRYGFGLGLFQGIITLEEARHRLSSLVCNLQDSCLLLESSDSFEKFYYMHDVVHDIGTIIAGSENCNMFVMGDDGGQKALPDADSLKRCEAFSILGGVIDQLPNEMECPKLRFFHVDLNDRSLNIPDSLFKGLDNLNVLDLKKMELGSLPSSLLLLRNLRTLCLHHCVLEDISRIGELKNLVILSLGHSKISELPKEVGSLDRLRMLDLSNCSKLQMIPPNVLSSLGKLEELYMGNSFVQWESEGMINNERKNASLAELNDLPHLTALEIQIPEDTNNAPADLSLEKLKRFIIFIGDIGDWQHVSDHTSRTLKVKFNPSFQPQFWVKLSKRAEDLHLDETLHGVESIIPEIDSKGFEQLKNLLIQNSAQLKYILNLRASVIAFPNLETFVLENMISLEEICHSKLPLTPFKKLRVLKVISCEKLRYVFSSSIARGLPLLEELEVRNCKNMFAIVVKEEGHGLAYGDVISFPRLQTLELEEIPKLVSFLSTKTSFMRDGGEIISEGNHDPDMPLLHYQVALPNLKILLLRDLPKINHIWSTKDSEIPFVLEQLEEISIFDCGMEEIVAAEGRGEATVARSLVFPRVTSLHLINLRRLKRFYKGIHISKWPMLEWLWIDGCENVEILVSGLQSFQETVKERRPDHISSIKQPLFLVNEELSFPSLEILEIESMKKLEIIWQDQVAISSFPNIQTMNICSCEKLETIFGKLEGPNGSETPLALIAPESRTKETVVIEDGGTRHLVSTVRCSSSLQKQEDLQKKIHSRSEDPNTIFRFQNLQDIEVSGCESLRSVFPSSVKSCLMQLKRLRIENCGVEEIVSSVEGQGKEPIARFVFPQLTDLRLRELHRLKWFYKGVHVSKWPKLEKMRIEKCHEVEILFASAVVRFQEAVEERRSEMSIKQPLFLVDNDEVVAFPSLEILHIDGLPKIKDVWTECSETNFGFQNLKELRIRDCGVEEIVAVEGGGGGGGGGAVARFVFPRVTDLELFNLRRLKWFYKGVHVSKWPMLKCMNIIGCEQIEKLVSGIPVSFEETVGENIKQPLFLVDEVVAFPSLEVLHIDGPPKIKHVWTEYLETNFTFQNLKDICVYGRWSLKSIFPTSVISCLQQLERLRIRDCGVEEIVAVEGGGGGGGGAVARFVFPRVTDLELSNLRRLKWFYKGVHVSKWPMLKCMNIIGCEQIQILVSGIPVSFEETVGENIKQPLFLVDERSFPSLELLDILWMKKLEIIWQDQVAISSFPNIQTLNIYSCEKLETIFGKLEGPNGNETPLALIAPESRTKESVVIDDGGTRHLVSTVASSSLQKQEDLPKQIHSRSEDTNTIFRFQNLQMIAVCYCENLRSVFTSSVISCLMQLKRLRIENCGVEEIVSVEGEGKEAVVRFVFPQLTDLRLQKLHRLKWFYKGVHVSKWPKLKEMWIEKCDEVEIFVSGVVRFQKAVEERRSEMSIKQPLFLVDNDEVVAFPSLEILHIDGPPKIKHVWTEYLETNFTFQNLKDICVYGRWSLKSIFPTAVISCLQQLERLQIDSCGAEEIVAVEGGGGGEAVARFVFPRVTDLKLTNLRRLKWFYKGVHVSKWPMLKCMKIDGCEQIEKLVSGIPVSFEEIVGENIKQPLFLVDELSFPSLERLDILWMKKLEIIWQDQVAISSFPNIQKLRISACKKLETIFGKLEGPNGNETPLALIAPESRTKESVVIDDGGTRHLVSTVASSSLQKQEDLPKQIHSRSEDTNTIFRFQNLQMIAVCYCENLRSVFTSSVISCLMQLKRLRIENCGVEEIVSVEGEGKEAVVRFVFPQLTDLRLQKLHRLKWFYKGVHVSKWPKLKEMWIEKCDEVEIFVSGVVRFQKAVEERRSEMSIKQPLFLVDNDEVVAFPSLEILHIDGPPKIKHVWTEYLETNFTFQNLKDICVYGRWSLKSIFPTAVISCLQQLERLQIDSCGAEEIVAVEGGGGGEAVARFVFPRVTDLKLTNLRRLKWFYKGVHVSKWPMLKCMKIDGCEQIEKLVSGIPVSFEEIVGENIKQPLFLVDELSFPSLERLDILWMKKLEIIWQDQVAISSFPNIQKLRISACKKLETIFGKLEGPNGNETPLALIAPESRTKESVVIDDGGTRHLVSTVASSSLQKQEDLPKQIHSRSEDTNTIFRFQNLQMIAVCYCENLRSVFTSSVISCLMQLKRLRIENCGVEEIVSVEGEGKEAVVRFVFPQLTDLRLQKLHRLKWFYKGVHVSKWPKLKEMWIEKCDEVEIFVSGVVRFQKAVEERRSEMSIKQPLFLVDNDEVVAFPSLEILHIDGPPKIKHVWTEYLETNFTFQNLKDICVYGRWSLKSIFPTAVISCLQQLERLQIDSCGAEEIVAVEGGGGGEAVARFVFPRVTDLKLTNLRRLKWFYKGVHVSKWPMLKCMKIDGCEQIEKLVSGIPVSFEEIVGENIKQPLFLVDELSFPSLERLDILWMKKLEIIWQDQVAISSFPNIQKLRISACKKLETIFGKLEGPNGNETPLALIAPESRTKESVVIDDGGTRHLVSTVASSSLQKQEDLPKQIHSRSEDTNTIFRFQNLQMIAVCYCENLRSVFTSSVISCLMQLKRLRIENCGVEEIVSVEGEGKEAVVRFVFPQLTDLRLQKLHRLKWFYKGVHVSKWPKLKEMWIEKCDEVEIFVSGVVRFQKAVEERRSEMSIKQPLFLVDNDEVVAFPSLEILHIDGPPKIKHVWTEYLETNFTFQNLKDICVYGRWSLKSIFPTAVISCLQQLERLQIDSCGAEEIVAVEGGGGGEAVARFVFPRVTDLKLTNLRRLKWFYKGVHVSKWPMLKCMNIIGCEQIEKLVSGIPVSFEETVGENIKQPLFLVDELSFPSLKTLDTARMDKLEIICHDQVAEMSFSNLQILQIFGCQQLRLPIFQSNILTAPIIQNLTELHLQNRQSLETIFGKHEGQNGKETQALQSTFPNLEVLSLGFKFEAVWPIKFSDFPPSFLARMPNLLKLEVCDSGWEEIFPNELLDREIQVLILPILRRLVLNRLPMLTHLWKEDTQPCPLFHNLEFLEVSKCAKLRNLVPSSVFLQNLTVLRISNCHGLINLVTSSTARSLTQLEKMSVTECKRITEIIAMEDGEANHLAITFNKLEYLELEGLPNLTNFCSGPYSFNFPSLEDVIVISCPEMKTFCQYGVLTTPQLTGVSRTEYEDDPHWEHDLNTTTHCLWELDHYDTRWLFRQSVENTEEDEDP